MKTLLEEKIYLELLENQVLEAADKAITTQNAKDFDNYMRIAAKFEIGKLSYVTKITKSLFTLPPNRKERRRKK